MSREQLATLQHFQADTAKIYHEWDDALGRNDVEALLALYAPDAVLESPLAPHLLGVRNGICRGHEQIRRLLEALVEHQPAERRFYRTGYLTDGQKLMWEYPRATPDDQQMDFVEVMEIKEGLIQHHRVYCGWYAVELLNRE